VSRGRALRMTDGAAYLAVSPQRVAQMRQERKLPEPDRVDKIGPRGNRRLSNGGPSGSGGERGVGGVSERQPVPPYQDKGIAGAS
jgi:hypothetical protein